MSDIHTEVDKLEAEIAGIEEAIIEQKRCNLLKKQWRDYHRRQGTADTGDVNIKQQVAFLKHSTGVVIKDRNISIVSQDDLSVQKKIVISGHCNENMFKLDLNTEQTMDSDTNVKSRILQLSISASENIQRDLKETVEKLIHEGNAQGFLTLLQPYSTWDQYREATFQHFMKQYPNIVTRPSVSILQLSHPNRNCTFDIIWKLKVTDIYNVLPDIKVKVQVPKKVKDSNTDILQTVPEKFHLMLEQLGVEQTFHTLVALLK